MVKAFLMGAGATFAQYPEAPLCIDFFKKFDKINDKSYDELNRLLQPYTISSLNKLNVEYVMSLYDKFPPHLKTKFRISLFSAIHQLLASQTESEIEDINRHIASIQTPTTLLHTLVSDNRLGKTDFFMTLNYDLYLDRELIVANNKINYGLPPELINKKHKYIDESLDFSIYQLHGALNWERTGNKVNIYLGAIKPKYPRNGQNILLVPPGDKNVFPPTLKKLWSEAEIRLLNADKLIIIGCSLSKYDEELINLVKKFIDKQGCRKVLVIDSINEKNFFATKDKHVKLFGTSLPIYENGFDYNSIEEIFK